MIACKAAVKAGQKLSPDEVSALLDRRHLVSDSHHCPHGRPTALVFTRSELERQFGRI
jgi:DNA mismatch repair protein MutL